jgi:hypothetical protein
VGVYSAPATVSHNPIVSRLAKSMPALFGVLVVSGCGGGAGGGETQATPDPTPRIIIDKTMDKIAVVEKAAAKKTAYGHVNGVFCQVKKGPCVVTYVLDGAPTCQMWAVKTMNGALVARPSGRLYYPDDPNARSCS